MRDTFTRLMENLATVDPSSAQNTPGTPAEPPSDMMTQLGDLFEGIYNQLAALYDAPEGDLWSIIMDACYALEGDGALPHLPEDEEPSPELIQDYLTAAKACDLPAKVLAVAQAAAGAPTPDTPDPV